MKTAGWIILGLAVIAVVAFLYHRHHRLASSSAPLLHVRNEFHFSVHGPYKVVAPLFGAEAERAWGGKHWDPRFLYPQPAQDVEGAVFTIHHGHHASATWINTAYDLPGGHFQYVYFIPDLMVTFIDIHLSERDAATTDAHVAYERTALNTAANDHVRDFGNSDRESGNEWGSAINDYLAKASAGGR